MMEVSAREKVRHGAKMQKPCSLCQMIKNELEFWIDRSTKTGLSSACRGCSNQRQREQYKNSGNKTKSHGYNIQAVYGISELGYQTLFTDQEGRCAICGVHQSRIPRRLHVDHDHRTGKVRGLLCGKCNSGIGLLKDEVSILQAAIQYLTK